jgi:hypothetical protein
MPTVAAVLRFYGDAYLTRFGSTMPAQHRKVLDAIRGCRRPESGMVYYACSSCRRTHAMGRSCGNRHCPSCQQGKARAWLEKQIARLLPCPYFLLTFTLPAGLRRFVRAHPRVGYAALFAASSEAIKRLAADPKYVGTKSPGFMGVLHTWGRTLEYHPHVHYVVPGGGLSDDGTRWLAARADFFVPVRALAKIFRGKFRDCLERAGLLAQIDPSVWRQDWVVHSQAAGDGQRSLKYLTPYVYRVAISDQRILACSKGSVTFAYRKSGSKRWRQMTVDAMEFIRRFLQHVLPTGFQKVRHYGFASPNAKRCIESVRWVVTLHYGREFFLIVETPVTQPTPRIRCPSCGGAMIVIGFVPGNLLAAARGPPTGRCVA